MIREITKEIKKCQDCPFLLKLGEYGWTYYNCPHFGESNKGDGTCKGDEKVEAQLEGWFENCPKWKEII